MILGKVVILNYRNVRLQLSITIGLIIGMLSFRYFSSREIELGVFAAFFLSILAVYGWGIYILSCKTVFKEEEETVLHTMLPIKPRHMLLGKTVVASLWGMAIGLSVWGRKVAGFWAVKSEDEFDSSGTVIYYFQILAAKLAAGGMGKWEMTLTIGLTPVFLLNFAATVYLVLSCVASFCYTSSHTKKPLAKGVVYSLCVLLLCGAAYGGYLLTAGSFTRIVLSQGIILIVAACACKYNIQRQTKELCTN